MRILRLCYEKTAFSLLFFVMPGLQSILVSNAMGIFKKSYIESKKSIKKKKAPMAVFSQLLKCFPMDAFLYYGVPSRVK